MIRGTCAAFIMSDGQVRVLYLDENGEAKRQ